jgi:hypothetical protein
MEWPLFFFPFFFIACDLLVPFVETGGLIFEGIDFVFMSG